MIKYKMDISEELKKRGYSSTRLLKEKILSSSTINNIRNNRGITTGTINVVCCILRCQPSDILEVIPTDEEKLKYF